MTRKLSPPRYSNTLTALCLACAAAPLRTSGAPAQLALLTDARYRGASACLDGSPYGLYFREGRDASRVLIVLQGGGFCTVLDEPSLRSTSCAFRAAQPPNASTMGSSLGWPPAIGDELHTLFGPPWLGLTSDDAALNPHLADFSLAFLPTCDGTAWASNVAEPLPVANGSRVFLRGRENLDAALRWLVGERGLALAAQVVLAGFSAGAAAVFLHVDHVASLLPASARLRGLADAGYVQNMQGQLGSNFTHLRFANASTFWQAKTNADCQASPGSAGAGNWSCLVPQSVLPFVRTPVFIIAAAYDDVIPIFAGDAEIQCSFVFNPACSATSLDWWRQYKIVTTANLAAAIPSESPHGLYLSACCPHCSSVTFTHNDTWRGLRVQGTSPADAFDEWLRGLPSRRIDAGEYGTNPSCVGWRG